MTVSEQLTDHPGFEPGTFRWLTLPWYKPCTTCDCARWRPRDCDTSPLYTGWELLLPLFIIYFLEMGEMVHERPLFFMYPVVYSIVQMYILPNLYSDFGRTRSIDLLYGNTATKQSSVEKDNSCCRNVHMWVYHLV